MATGVPHEDSPELTPLAQDVPNPLALAAAGSDLAKVEVEREDALQGDGQAGDQMEVKDEDEEMDEMDSDGEGDAEDYERERARIIKWAQPSHTILIRIVHHRATVLFLTM